MTAMFKGAPETELPSDDALTTTAGNAVMMTLTCNVLPRCWCCSACVERKAKASQQGQGNSGCHGNDVASLPHSNWDGNGKRLRCQWFENNVMEGGGRRRRVRWEMDVRHGRLDECGDSDEDEVGRDAFQRVVPADTADHRTHALFVDAFVYNSRLEHMIQVMGYHPHYLSAFLAMHHTVLQGPHGPLPYDQRHYIAIMAASRHQCSYLVHLQSIEFLLQDGDERWLSEGLQCPRVPRKLRNLATLNRLMAHQPWLIDQFHIANLLRGEDSWSLSELTHAVVLMAHFHSLSSFIYGCGISAEVDTPLDTPSSDGLVAPDNGLTPQSRKSSTASMHDLMMGDVEALLEMMRKLNEEEQCDDDEVSQEELLQRFTSVENQCAELPASSVPVSHNADTVRFVEYPEFTYQDFAKFQNTTPTFRIQEFSWEDHGFFQADSLYRDIATLLDDKFKIAFNLTYNTMGDNKHVDTTSFRRALWYYVQCLFGIRHDDYNYGYIGRLLDSHLKSYIKIVTCYPEVVGVQDYDNFMKGFKHSEKVHVNLMLLEARLQAELLYVLRAITEWQKHRT